MGWARSISSVSHGHEVAVQHAGQIGEGFVQRDGREVDREAAGLLAPRRTRFDQQRHGLMVGVVAAVGVGDAHDRAIERIAVG